MTAVDYRNCFTGDAFDPAELRSIIEADMMHAPRTLQKRIGPSELGMACDRCLTHKLIGTEEKKEAAWLPYIGTCVHEHLEKVFKRHEAVRAMVGMPHRYLIENRVCVGEVGGTEITGSTDLFDAQTGTVIDWKIVGTNTLKKSKAHGAKDQYRYQAALYARGWSMLGYTVKRVCVYFMPRNAIRLSHGYPWVTAYQPQLAVEALARADAIAQAIQQIGGAAVLDQTGEHIGDPFTCDRYADYHPLPGDKVSGIDPSNPFG